MRLVSFRVRLFRNIVDSGDVPVENVTALVGKNESGKSALLQALHHLNPAKPAVALNLLDEYPRWLKKEHEIAGTIDQAVPITAVFDLADEDLSELRQQLGAEVLRTPQVTASRKYATPGVIDIDADIDYQAFVGPIVDGYSSKLKKAVGTVNTSDELIKTLRSLSTAGQGDDEAELALADVAAEALAALEGRLSGHNLRSTVEQFIQARLPRTFYFSSYSQLRGRYSMDEVIRALNNPTDDEEVVAAADFLRLARVVPENINDWDYESSNAELEAVSSLLSKRVRDHWKQNDHLRLAVRIEDQKITLPNGQPGIERYLQFRVEDGRHDFSSRLDRRSTGFQWFISFLASFLEFETETDLILLLDEPGLSLHARAQMDLLITIEAKLAQERPVIYSTHSPFMIQPTLLNEVRIVEDGGPERGSTVIRDAGVVTDPDTLFPLQAALGYDLAQNLFIGNQNVLVEGVSDFIYLTTVSGHLQQQGRSHLAESTRVIPAGGASNIPTFIALLGAKLDVVVLIDGGTSDQRIADTIAKGRVDAAKVLSLSTFLSVPKPDIEDVFTPSEYLAFYNAAFGKNLKVGDLKGTDRIVDRIARHEGGPFNHGIVAATFLQDLNKSIKSLSTGTLDRFEAIIRAINAALPPIA